MSTRQNRILLTAVILAGTIFFAGRTVLAQEAEKDPLKLAPGIYSLLFENDQVRVYDIRFEAGDRIAMHSHPDHILYILSPGTIKLSYADGTSKDVTVEAGQVLWSNAESHQSENSGTTEVHAIIVELKKAAASPPALPELPAT